MTSSDPEFIFLLNLIKKKDISSIMSYDLYLLRQYINTIDKMDGCSLFMWSIRYCSYSIAEYFLKKANPILTMKSKNGYTAFHWICYIGNTSLLNLYICYDKFFNVNSQTSCPLELSGLHIAIENDHYNIVRSLLKCSKINVNILNSNDETPLHIAIEKNSVRIVKELLKYNASIELMNKKNNTPLLLATKLGRIEIIKTILNSSINSNELNDEKEFEEKKKQIDLLVNLNNNNSILSNIIREVDARNKLKYKQCIKEKNENKDSNYENNSKEKEKELYFLVSQGLYDSSEIILEEEEDERFEENEEIENKDKDFYDNKTGIKSFNNYFSSEDKKDMPSTKDEYKNHLRIYSSFHSSITPSSTISSHMDSYPLSTIPTSFKGSSFEESYLTKTLPTSLSPSYDKDSSIRNSEKNYSCKIHSFNTNSEYFTTSLNISPQSKDYNSSWFSSIKMNNNNNKISPIDQKKPKLSLIHPDQIQDDEFVSISYKESCCIIS